MVVEGVDPGPRHRFASPCWYEIGAINRSSRLAEARRRADRAISLLELIAEAPLFPGGTSGH